MKVERDYRISSEELYFMAVAMGAEVMDYEYVASMGGIQKDYELHRMLAMKSLEDRGLISEDFSGDVEIDEDFSEALRPMFFGRLECNIDIGCDRYKLHVLGEKMTLAWIDDSINIKRINTDMLASMLEGEDFDISCSHIDKGTYKEGFSDFGSGGAPQTDRLTEIINGNYCI